MRRLEFEATSDEEEVRRWQRESRPVHSFGSALGGNFGWFLIGLAGLYVYHGYLNYNARFGRSTTLIEGKLFAATNVILLVDASGSMKAHYEGNQYFPDTAPILQRQLDHLRASGISVGERNEPLGFGFSVVGHQRNALHILEAALKQNPTADAVYLFSDFDPTNVPYEPDYSDADGYAQLRELLGRGHRRLYLGTVRKQPDTKLIQIARESGGDVIESK